MGHLLLLSRRTIVGQYSLLNDYIRNFTHVIFNKELIVLTVITDIALVC